MGAVAFCNITLGYGLLALASTHQLAAVELEFRVPEAPSLSAQSLVRSLKGAVAEEERDIQSLLLASPLDIDELITSIRRSKDTDYHAHIRKLPEHMNPLQTISASHLRVLGEVTSQIQARIQAIRAASQAIENRLDLEVQEFQRQLQLLKDCSNRTSELKQSQTKARAQEMVETQGRLAERLDKVLTAMSAEYRPQIGEMEKKWFDELERLRARIRGGGTQRAKGLAGRVNLVSDCHAANG